MAYLIAGYCVTILFWIGVVVWVRRSGTDPR